MALTFLGPIAAGLTMGFGYGNIGGIVQNSAFNDFYGNPSDTTRQFLSSTMMLGCVAGSMLGGVSADRFGRRGSGLIAASSLAFGSLMCTLPLLLHIEGLAPIFVGRGFIGLGVGTCCCAIPTFVSEVAPQHLRGAASASLQLSVCTGILAANIFNFKMLTLSEQGWCFSFAMQFPLALMFLVAMWVLPESPRWLMSKGSEAKAEVALRRWRRGADDESLRQELFEIRGGSCAPEGATAAAEAGWGELCSWRVFVAMFALAAQVGAGVDMVTVYGPDIFNHFDGDEEATSLMDTIFVGVTMVVFTGLAVLLVDRLGRKPLLMIGSLGMTVSLALLALPLGLKGAEDVVCVLGFIAFFSISLGPIAWVIPGEMVHSRIRAKVLGVGAVLNWLTDYAVVNSFLSLNAALGQAGAFAVYSTINLLIGVFLLAFVEETAGKALDQPDSAGSFVHSDANVSFLCDAEKGGKMSGLVKPVTS